MSTRPLFVQFFRSRTLQASLAQPLWVASSRAVCALATLAACQPPSWKKQDEQWTCQTPRAWIAWRVGGWWPLLFRLDNIVMSRLYRPGSVAYVSKSGGMLGPQCQDVPGISKVMAFRHVSGPMSWTTSLPATPMVSMKVWQLALASKPSAFRCLQVVWLTLANSVPPHQCCSACWQGGDRYPGSRFLDHFLRYQEIADQNVISFDVFVCDLDIFGQNSCTVSPHKPMTNSQVWSILVEWFWNVLNTLDNVTTRD